MKVIRSLGNQDILLDDFNFAISQRNDNQFNILYSYHFKSCIINDSRLETFKSFAREVCSESYVLDLGDSIMNLINVTALELIPVKTSFKFHFNNSSEFEFVAPVELRDPLKYKALSKILMDAFYSVENIRKVNGHYTFNSTAN